MKLHINYIYSMLEKHDAIKIIFTSGMIRYATLNTTLVRKISGRRVCRNRKLEKIAKNEYRVRAYFPEYRTWDEIPLELIESIHETNHARFD